MIMSKALNCNTQQAAIQMHPIINMVCFKLQTRLFGPFASLSLLTINFHRMANKCVVIIIEYVCVRVCARDMHDDMVQMCR